MPFQSVSGLSSEMEVIEFAAQRLSSPDIGIEELTIVIEHLERSAIGRRFVREVLGEVVSQWQLTDAMPTKSPALDRLGQLASRGTLAGRVQEAISVRGWSPHEKKMIVGKARR